MNGKYEVVIGLEVHSQIKTDTKVFVIVQLIFILSLIQISVLFVQVSQEFCQF